MRLARKRGQYVRRKKVRIADETTEALAGISAMDHLERKKKKFVKKGAEEHLSEFTQQGCGKRAGSRKMQDVLSGICSLPQWLYPVQKWKLYIQQECVLGICCFCMPARDRKAALRRDRDRWEGDRDEAPSNRRRLLELTENSSRENDSFSYRLNCMHVENLSGRAECFMNMHV